MIQLLMWKIDLYPHRESWPPEQSYEPFGFGRPFTNRGRIKFGTDDFGAVEWWIGDTL